MTPQTIVHVGPHKTGSTALQHAFRDGRDALAANGIHYARTGMRGYAQFDLIDWARGRRELDPRALCAEGDIAPTLLISCENVVHLDEEAQVRLQGALPDDRPVRIVYFLRRLVDLWVSHWAELVKHGLPLSIADHVANQAAIATSRNNRIDQMEQVRTLERTFGEGTVEVIGYDAARGADGGIVAEFVRHVLGLDPAALALPDRTVNAREARARTELVRLVNRIHADVEGRVATQELRLAVFRALDAGEVPFKERFDAVVEARTVPGVIQVSDMVAARQERTARMLEPMIHGGQAALDAYLNPRRREIDRFDFPVTGEEALLAEIVAFYRSLPEAARRSVGGGNRAGSKVGSKGGNGGGA